MGRLIKIYIKFYALKFLQSFKSRTALGTQFQRLLQISALSFGDHSKRAFPRKWWFHIAAIRNARMPPRAFLPAKGNVIRSQWSRIFRLASLNGKLEFLLRMELSEPEILADVSVLVVGRKKEKPEAEKH